MICLPVRICKCLQLCCCRKNWSLKVKIIKQKQPKILFNQCYVLNDFNIDDGIYHWIIYRSWVTPNRVIILTKSNFSDVYLKSLCLNSLINIYIFKIPLCLKMNQSATNRITSRSFYHRVCFLLSLCEGAASCLLPGVPRLHQAPQAPPWRTQLAPLPGDRGQRGKRSVISVWYGAGCSEVWGPLRSMLYALWSERSLKTLREDKCVCAQGRKKMSVVYLLTSFSQPGRYKPCLPSLPWPSGLFPR